MRTLIITLLVAALYGPSASAQTFSDDAWKATEDIYGAILRHPFLEQLQDGTLDQDIFKDYLVQDAHYLGVFGRALLVVADKAPRAEWAERLKADGLSSLAEEKNLHTQLLDTYGLGPEEVAAIEQSPDGFAYTNYMLAIAHDRPFGEGLAVLLPCYWIYLEVGKNLARAGSPDPTYQAWIDSYASDTYDATVRAALDIADAVAAEDPETAARMQYHYRRASLYEWMFWDSAFQRRGWPLDADSSPQSSGASR